MREREKFDDYLMFWDKHFVPQHYPSWTIPGKAILDGALIASTLKTVAESNSTNMLFVAVGVFALRGAYDFGLRLRYPKS